MTMWWPFQWIVIYVLGGLTFVPLVIVVVIGYVLTYGSVPIGDADPAKRDKAALQDQAEKDAALERVRSRSHGPGGGGGSGNKPLSGWLTVRRQFQPIAQSSSIFTSNSPTTDLTGAELPDDDINGDKDKEGDNGSNSKDDTNSVKSGSSTPTPAPATYSARIAQTYRQMVEARQSKKDSPPKEFFWCVLKGSVLFLYEDEAQSECIAAIGVDKYMVGVETSEGGKFTGKDAEMFAKRNACVLRILEKEKTNGGNGHGNGEGKEGLPVLAKGMEAGAVAGGGEKADEEREMENAPWFLFSKSNTKMEDWYIALVQASSLRPTTADVFASSDMQALVDTIDTEPDPIPMRWFNAMLGRIFFGVYRTEALEQFIIGKIMKKLSKVPRPSFLGPIVIREVNVGTFPPIFSKPMLKDLSAEGTASFEVHLNYRSRPRQPNSEVRITVATTATIPTGFKPYTVDLVLAVVLNSLEGNMVVQIKRPPSNRVWYGFTHMPKMEVEIIPVVSERKIQIGMVLKAMEKQLREVIAESVVLPNMDDIAFFDTSSVDIRGGIFSQAGKVVKEPTTDVPSGGNEMPTQTGVDVETCAEDPSSATAETPGLRKRRPTKSQTVNVNGGGGGDSLTSLDEEDEKISGIGLPRTETAPANIGSTQGAKKSAAIQATKKWFAGGARPASTSSLSGIGVQSNTSQESLSSRSKGRDRESSMRRDSSPGGVAADTTASATDQGEERETEISTLSSSTSKGHTSSRSVGRLALDSTSTNDALHLHDPSTSPTSSSSSFITSIRARDKKAVQAQVSSAKDAVKKWGVNWAAKRRNNLGNGTLDERDEDRPTAIYRPPDEDERGGEADASSRSAEGPQTLRERLEAAAMQAQARPVPSRQRSVSSATPSRPTLLTPETKSSIAPPGSPPARWTLSSPGPTTEVAKADVSTTVSVPSPARNPKSEAVRRGSSSNPVYTQPSAGTSMVVPRMPKRPGEVIGIGSSELGITRRISDSEGGSGGPTKMPTPTNTPPVLPPRLRASERSAAGDTLHSETETGRDVGSTLSPPRLPPRRPASDPSPPTASSTDISTRSKRSTQMKTKADTPSPPPSENDLERPGSAPAVAAAPSLPRRHSTKASEEEKGIGGSESDTNVEVQPPSTSSTVQDLGEIDKGMSMADAVSVEEEAPGAEGDNLGGGSGGGGSGEIAAGPSAADALRQVVKHDDEVRGQDAGE